ncbi:MAG: cytochrome P460 family protein [Pseudomonadota bacterium]
MKQSILNLALSSLMLVAASAHAGDNVDYPDGYRTWTHIKTMVLHKGHPLENPFMGIHHVYGNEKAVEGTKSGQFGEGAVLVFDLLEYMTADNASTEGDRVLVGVMVKDNSKYQSTGGWGFEGFAGDSPTKRLVNDGGKSCFDCHASQQEHNYVFTRWRD